MLEEYFIWKKIFEEADDFEIHNLIKLVIVNEDARDYVYEKILQLKYNPKEMVTINITIDKNLKDINIEEIVDKIVTQILEKKDIKITS